VTAPEDTVNSSPAELNSQIAALDDGRDHRAAPAGGASDFRAIRVALPSPPNR